MGSQKTTDERMAALTMAQIYPCYLAKVEKKGRTQAELDQVIGWLTGYDAGALADFVAGEGDMGAFFAGAEMHVNAAEVKGVICGVRVEEIENPLTQKIRQMDKLVDELAKGKAMEKILRG